MSYIKYTEMYNKDMQNTSYNVLNCGCQFILYSNLCKLSINVTNMHASFDSNE